MSGPVVLLNRREFLELGLIAAGGLTLGVSLDSRATEPAHVAGATDAFAPNAFVRIGSDNTVTVIVKHIEFGQGTYTGLPTLVAEELDADWAQIRVEAAPADASRYNNLNWGPVQGTGGSSSLNNSWQQLREAGATARAMLVAAASTKWQVPGEEIAVARGVLTHAPSGRTASFGELAALAASQPLPHAVTLKPASAFVYIGKHVPRSDQRSKLDGTAMYTLDYTRPGMLTALVLHPPRFGATWKAFRDAAARQVKGVVEVIPLPSGIAVVARDFWSAKKGRDALEVDWDEDAAFKLGSAEILAQFRALAEAPGVVARRDGDPAPALASAARVVESTYEFPYLAHAAMEPMNCVAEVSGDGCELWYGAQSQSGDQRGVAHALGLEPKQVRINMLYAGGSFGRRADTHADYVIEAALIAQKLGHGKAVKLVWTREDDMRSGRYRPMYYHVIRAGLDQDGKPVAWQQRIVGQSLLAGTPMAPAPGKADRTIHEGASDLPYAIPNFEVDVHAPALAVPVLWWRSVGHTHTAFSTETFFDELAHAAGKDTVEFRLGALKDDARRRAVIELAARESGWGTPLASGRGRGIAVHRSFKTYVAEVAEVTVAADGSFSVDKVTVAVDCGIAVNPDVVRAQMEGGVGYGLSAALNGAITLADGVVEQDNFDGYPVLRLSQMPDVTVHIVASSEDPTGVGEPAVPPIAPAVANALFAATGKRYRRLPFTLGPDDV